MSKQCAEHKCELDGCDIMTTNKHYCCRAHQVIGMRKGYKQRLDRQTKRCRACGEVKPLSEFVWHYDIHANCKSCCDGGRVKQAKPKDGVMVIVEGKPIPAAPKYTQEDLSRQYKQAIDEWTSNIRLGNPYDPVPSTSAIGMPFAA